MGRGNFKKKLPLILPIAVLGTGFVLTGITGKVEARKGQVHEWELVDKETCFACHGDIKAFKTRGKHQNLNCGVCHSELEAHLGNPVRVKAKTKIDHAVCGQCHKDQYESFISSYYKKNVLQEKSTPQGRSPILFDNIMRPHGFTREHAEPRSHVFALVDHLRVDRAYGGRFRPITWYALFDEKLAAKSAWEILYDKDPKSNEQKIFPPFTPRTAATAANPVCLHCKTSDLVLKWAYMGDKNPKAKWDRTSPVVDVARDTKLGFSCIQCHDPHSTEPRVIRDALIEAVVDRKMGTYPYDPEKSSRITMQKVTFRDFRAIGILNKPDAVLMCAQCHVEYNCNPGIDTKTGQPVTMADRRTNWFPWVNVFDALKAFDSINFRDFRHEVTGALLPKIQHPEVEVFWGSKHERAGLTCADCHMPKVKGKDGKVYTFHGARSPRYLPGGFQVCTRCHTGWTPEDAQYVVDGIKNYVRGKMRKAEFWLSKLVDTYQLAQAVGVPEDVLKRARDLHAQAHVYWEWWTAENSDGFHNPDQAIASLNKAIQLAIDGVTQLEKAIRERQTAKK